MRPASTLAAAAAAALLAARASGLNNGLGAVPQRGYNSWYHVGMNPSAESLLATAAALKTTGLQALGYTYVSNETLISTIQQHQRALHLHLPPA